MVTYTRRGTPNEQHTAWVDLLRANCLLLVERPRVANAVSISRGFTHLDERDAVVALAQGMAGEYGLRAEFDVRGHFLTIRFTREAEERGSNESTPAPSLLNRILTPFRSRSGRVSEKEQAAVEDENAEPAEVRS
jgi:hypothetical protein